MGAFEVTKWTKPNLKILMTFNFVAVAHTFGILIANRWQEDFCLWYAFRPLELDALWAGLCARCHSCTWISSCTRNTGWKDKCPIRHSWNPCWKSSKSKPKMCSLDSQLPRPLFACTGVTAPHGVSSVLRFETGRHETSRFSILFKTVVAVPSLFQLHANFRISLLIGAIKGRWNFYGNCMRKQLWSIASLKHSNSWEWDVFPCIFRLWVLKLSLSVLFFMVFRSVSHSSCLCDIYRSNLREKDIYLGP